MNVYQKKDGQVLLSARDYDIAPDTKVMFGQVVCLEAGLVVAAGAAPNGAILGIAAENHSGVEDALDGRSNGPVIRVYDDPDVVMQCAVPVITASGGSATTVTSTGLGAFTDDDFNGGYLKLIEKGANSANPDPIGTIKRITDSAYTANGTVSTLTVASGGAAGNGDKFELYPPIGFAKGNLNAGRTALVLSTIAALSLKVAGHDRARGKINLIAKTHVLGA